MDEFLERVEIEVLRRYVGEISTKGTCKPPTSADSMMWKVVATAFSRIFESEKDSKRKTFRNMKLERIRNAMLQIRVESDLREIVQEIEIAQGGTKSDPTDRLVRSSSSSVQEDP